MNQCLRISFKMKVPKNFLKNFIQKHARALGLEGTAQVEKEDLVEVIACGTKDAIDSFLDELHKKSAKQPIENIEIEPFMKNKDYRGVFRVIE